MAGIDGALPKNALGAEECPSKDFGSSTKPLTSAQEPTEGLSQVDYLRRLADQVAAKNRALGSRREIRTLAVLGSDIYDKLQILRTLRPRLPAALFLTNDLDARYGHPDEWDATRNLLVASNYGLVPDPRWKSETPPFRDSTQTAVYAAARLALRDRGCAADNAIWKGRPRMFEVGRRGPVELSTVHVGTTTDPSGFIWTINWWKTLGCSVCVGMLTLLLRANVEPPKSVTTVKPAEANPPRRWFHRSGVARSGARRIQPSSNGVALLPSA